MTEREQARVSEEQVVAERYAGKRGAQGQQLQRARLAQQPVEEAGNLEVRERDRGQQREHDQSSNRAFA